MISKFVVAIFLLAFFLRLLPVLGGNFPFMYDHAKDSLVIMEMGREHKPALFGAVTSIPGVFNGPAYYYLALIPNVLFGYDPFVNVLLIISLSALNVWLAYKYFGKLTAVFFATSIGLIGAQTSAWSPYMTTFITLGVIILLDLIIQKSKNQPLNFGILFFLISLCFHFQTAFGVVLLPLVLLVLALHQTKVSINSLFVSVIAFALPFLPFLIFELRHDFHQTKEIVRFINNYSDQAQQIGDNQSGIFRLLEIISYSLTTVSQSVLPISLKFLGELEQQVNMVLGEAIIIAIIGTMYLKRNMADRFNWKIYLPLLWGPSVLYLFLPAKSYYFVALIPIWILLISQFLEKYLNKTKQNWLIVVVIVLSLINLVLHIQANKTHAQQSSDFYGPKLAAIEKVYELSGGEPFASYHFVPEVYDYPYQFLYLREIALGRPIPVEFSYAPGESSYILQKHVEVGPIPELVFLIVEEKGYQNVRDEWWGRVASQFEIVKEYRINDEIVVYRARK